MGQATEHAAYHVAAPLPAPEAQPAGGYAPSWARFAWFVVVCPAVVTFLISASQNFSALTSVCDNACVVTPAIAHALADAHIPLVVFLWATLLLDLMILLVALTMGIILFVRRSNEWMALLISCYVVIYPLKNILGSATTSTPTLSDFIGVIYAAIALIPFLVFPSGRFVPRWSWVILVGWIVFWVAFNIFNVDFPLGYLIVYASLIGCQVYRYRSVSTPVERERTKWVLYGFVASLVANQLFWTPGFLPFMAPLAQTLYVPLAYLLFQVSLLFVPVTFFIAIQRHRLFDIDVIINRTLVYGSSTLLLAAIYAGSVLGLQALAQLLTGQGSPVAIVASTLLIAALFAPLRRQAQRIIDRRFYRDRYDAQRIVADFGATLRTQVELDELTGALVEVAHATLRPAHASLWLREPARAPERPAS